MHACSVVGDTEIIARIRGAAAQMASFDFYQSVLGEMLFHHTDNLSSYIYRTLQDSHVSAAEGQVVATVTMSILASLRNDERFDFFGRRSPNGNRA